MKSYVKSYDDLKEPKEVTIGKLSCAVSKIPAFYAQRIILAAGSALSDMDMTKLPESVLLELLSYCAVKNPSGEYKVLDDLGVVNLLIDSPKDLIALEIKAVEYNFGFFWMAVSARCSSRFSNRSRSLPQHRPPLRLPDRQLRDNPARAEVRDVS